MDRALLEYWTGGPGDFLGALFAHSSFLAVSFDADGRVLQQSQALARLTGRDNAALEGQPLTEILAESAAPLFTGVVLPGLVSNGSVNGVDLDLIDRIGRTVPVRVSALCELDASGAVIRAVAVLTDLRETRAALEALDRKAEEAEEASEAKSRFLAAMSHEIRTPMNAILGFAQLLDMSELDATHRTHVRAIMSAGQALMTLLTDLLDLSLVEAGQMRVAPQPFDIAELLEEVAGWWHAAAAEKGLTLSVTAAPDLPRQVISDRGRVQQVLNNYLGNAVKFTETGRIDLHVAPHTGDDGAPLIRFRVSDTGPGIAAGDVARLYRPFVQIEGAQVQGAGGWGLGLSICANIAEAMGADVGVETEPGKGSVFWFDLPLRVPVAVPVTTAPAAELSVEHPPADDTAPPTPRRILVAEDDRLNQEVMRRILRGMGHEVTLAANGFEVLQALDQDRFDLVLMDIMMPGLDGIGTMRRLRASDMAQRDIPVIACSAHVSPTAEATYREIGMNGFLPKPVDRAALVAVIERAMVPDSE